MAPGIAAALGWVSEVTIGGRRASAARHAAKAATKLSGFQFQSGETTELDLEAFDVIIETVVEKLEVKRTVLEQLSQHSSPDALIATNTSSLSLATLSDYVTAPERFIGMHFLNPAAETGVVELGSTNQTDPSVLARGLALVQGMGKHGIVVERESPGLVWNRIQFAVLRECLHLLETGVASADDIDLAVSAGLAPRWMAAGPLATADLGGLATFALVSEQLFPVLADGHDVSAELDVRARAGTTFHEWTAAERETVERRRSVAIALAARVWELRSLEA
jgi:3-hydroxybutyryl-CoA dehydrogenase